MIIFDETVINNKFSHGDTVYLVTDPDQYRRIVTGLEIRPGMMLMYELSLNHGISKHYEFEISGTMDLTV